MLSFPPTKKGRLDSTLLRPRHRIKCAQTGVGASVGGSGSGGRVRFSGAAPYTPRRISAHSGNSADSRTPFVNGYSTSLKGGTRQCRDREVSASPAARVV